MSRTDKDKPYWVRAEWYEPYHYCGWRKVRKYVATDKPLYWDKTRFEKRFVGYAWKYFGDCELPETPIVGVDMRNRRRNGSPSCGWWPVRSDNERYFQTRGAPHKRFWRHSEFYGPQRMNERLAAREVIKGNTEEEFPDGRGRHSVLRDMW